MMPFFDAAAPTDSVFTEKGALDPLAAPDDIRGRETQQAQLARLLGGVTEGYLPPTVAIHGSPGIGKTMTTDGSVESSRRVTRRWRSRFLRSTEPGADVEPFGRGLLAWVALSGPNAVLLGPPDGAPEASEPNGGTDRMGGPALAVDMRWPPSRAFGRAARTRDTARGPGADRRPIGRGVRFRLRYLGSLLLRSG
jgi:hypothetical protein